MMAARCGASSQSSLRRSRLSPPRRRQLRSTSRSARCARSRRPTSRASSCRPSSRAASSRSTSAPLPASATGRRRATSWNTTRRQRGRSSSVSGVGPRCRGPQRVGLPRRYPGRYARLHGGAIQGYKGNPVRVHGGQAERRLLHLEGRRLHLHARVPLQAGYDRTELSGAQPPGDDRLVQALAADDRPSAQPVADPREEPRRRNPATVGSRCSGRCREIEERVRRMDHRPREVVSRRELLESLDAELRRNVAVVVGEHPVHRDRQACERRPWIETAWARGAHRLQHLRERARGRRLALARRACPSCRSRRPSSVGPASGTAQRIAGSRAAASAITQPA